MESGFAGCSRCNLKPKFMNHIQSSAAARPSPASHGHGVYNCDTNSIGTIGLALLAQVAALLLLTVAMMADPRGWGGAMALLSSCPLLIYMVMAGRQFVAACATGWLPGRWARRAAPLDRRRLLDRAR